MIFTDRTVIVQKGTSSINDTIVLYRGDKGVEIRFTLNEGSPFRFGSGASPNIIEKTEAAYGQLVIETPNDLPTIFGEVAPTNEGKIVFTITGEMIDEITEVGKYTFQIRLLDENMNSRATLPEVVDGIEIREPIAVENNISNTNEVDAATVGYALTTAAANEDAFDTQGNYNKTTWKTKDRITAAKLNKMEAAIDGVNQKVASGNNAGDISIADTGNNFTATDVEGALQEVCSQIKEKATKQEVDVERKRIDSFTTLAEGSTTGDAELIDARVGADGVIYDNLGNCIREQIKLINSIEFPKNIFNKDTVVNGKFRSSADGSEKDNPAFSYNIVQIEPNTNYIMTGSDFDMQFFDANMNFLGYSNKFKGDNVVFSCDNPNVKYVAINYTTNVYNTDTYMVCKGTKMPSSFEKYGTKKLKRDITVDYSQISNAPNIENITIDYSQITNAPNIKDITIDYSQITNAPTIPTGNSVKTYTVGTNGQYKTFTEMLRALKDDTSEKIVYIERGTYDIFEEMGGTDFTTRINNDNTITNWKQCCDIVPNNTKLIGVGEVVLKYKPTAEQTNEKCAFLISPLNIMRNTYVENITVEGTNCRYTIHQENSAGLGNDSAVCKMKNVKAMKWRGSYGYPQVFGSGIGKDANWEFDNCEFYSDMPHIWTVHTNEPRAGHSASIIMNNCIIDAITPSEATKTREMIRFITGDEGVDNPAHNKAKMNNCYVGGKLTLAYDGKLNTIYNSWDLLLNNVHTELEEVYSQFAGNNYPIKKYTY